MSAVTRSLSDPPQLPTRSRRWVTLLAAVVGVAAFAAGVYGVMLCVEGWRPCFEGKGDRCLDLQYEQNPLVGGAVVVWLFAAPIVTLVGLGMLQRSAPAPLRILGPVGAALIGMLNPVVDYAITVGGSADSGPGFGIPMNAGLALAGAILTFGALRVRGTRPRG